MNYITALLLAGGFLGWLLFFYTVYLTLSIRSQEIKMITAIKSDLETIRKDIEQFEKTHSSDNLS